MCRKLTSHSSPFRIVIHTSNVFQITTAHPFYYCSYPLLCTSKKPSTLPKLWDHPTINLIKVKRSNEYMKIWFIWQKQQYVCSSSACKWLFRERKMSETFSKLSYWATTFAKQSNIPSLCYNTLPLLKYQKQFLHGRPVTCYFGATHLIFTLIFQTCNLLMFQTKDTFVIPYKILLSKIIDKIFHNTPGQVFYNWPFLFQNWCYYTMILYCLTNICKF